ncbi:MAG TPA: hypothetical protein VM452_11655 [Caulifigura sp.]|nr:hypothetical protein [Caulifigura sp.]
MKNLLAAALVVSVASIALSQAPVKPRVDLRDAPAPVPAPVAAPAPAPGMAVPVKTPRWEYMVSDRGGFEPGDWQKKLNDLAKEGWELDAIDEGHYIVKRPVRVRLAPGAGFGGMGMGGFDAPGL